MQPLIFESYFRPQPWGGRRFERVLGKQLPDAGRYGESWQLSAHPLHISRVAEGPFAGRLLTELWQDCPTDLWGEPVAEEFQFPLLVKLLDCDQALSVQVHPDDTTADRLLPDERGKAEAWIVLDAEPTARIYAGLKPGVTRDVLLKHLNSGTVVNCLHSLIPRPRDCIFVKPGTVHAIGGGVLLAEVQQTSDATFRLFDWDRVGLDGTARPLHVDESLASINWELGPVGIVRPRELLLRRPNAEAQRLIDGPYFRLERFLARSEFSVPYHEQMSVWMVLAGEADLTAAESGYRRRLRRGDTALIPATSPTCSWLPCGAAELLGVTVPQATAPIRKNRAAECQTAERGLDVLHG